MSDSQPTSPSNFFAVSWGQQRGVYTSYKEAQAAMKGFPSPVYKKFKNREEAEEFVKKCQPESTSIEADENDQKFYAVARGRVIGIFKDMETVKKHTKGYPNSMHKKFDSIDEAKQYLEKFSEGKVEEKKASPKKQKEQPSPAEAQAQQVDGKMDGEEEQQEEEEAKATDTKPVGGSQSGNLAPRKRTYETKVADAEEETGEKKVAEETIAEGEEEEKKEEEKMEEEGEEKEKKEEEKVNGEEEKEGKKEEKMDAEEEKEEEGEEPSQKKTKLEEKVEKKAKLNDEEEEVKEKSGEQDQAKP